jgi:hypothetical protein
MTIHVEFIKHNSCTEYTFLDRHTSEEIAFGSYNGEGDFEVLSLRDGGVDRYASAAVAWTSLNRKLMCEYGY